MKKIAQLFDKFVQIWTPSYGTRFGVILGCLLAYVAFICYCSFRTVVMDRPHYDRLIGKLRRDSVPIGQLRGVIYSESGDMIAASLPKYDVFFDFRRKDEKYFKTVSDTAADGKISKRKVAIKLLPKDTMDYYFSPNGPAALYMHQLVPGKSAAEHAAGMRKAYAAGAKRYLAMRSITYLQRKQMLKSAPFFSKDPNHIGLFTEERPHRYRPYGEYRMASSTIGGVFPTDTFRMVEDKKVNMKGHGRNGLEQTFDEYLSGRPGLGFSQRIRNRNTVVVQQEPEDGADVFTTINMEMQTILDFELNKRILELRAAGGWAAVMEVKTGKIKAISNLKRFGDHCSEDYNHFVQDVYDPGSTFKTVSYMVLLDDGKITPDTEIDTGNYPGNECGWNYHGKTIRDDHPIGRKTAQEAMAQSSNIALSKLTTQAYENDKQRYLDLIDEMRIFEDLHLENEFQGAQRPRNRKVGDKTWSKVSLGQISYGYETRIPGMYILNFYNAIANNGKLMRPYIVDRVVKDGVELYYHEPEVINSQICKSSTLKMVRQALEDVVDHGTARTEWNSKGGIIKQGVKSQKLKIAGKTGTAQRYANGNYSTNNGHYVSFAGYFPADDPQYTCVVVIDVRPGVGNGKPGGGYMAGPVFRNFAEQVYARSCYQSVKDLRPDSANVAELGIYPKAKKGPEAITDDVLEELNLGKDRDRVGIEPVRLGSVTENRVPNVVGMGAMDALYQLESAGLRVNVTGRGRVVSQSIPAGSQCVKGSTVAITLRQ